MKSRKEKRGRPPKSITDPKMCSDTRQRKVKHFRVTFKEWCAELGCEVNQLNGIFLYLSNICAKCAKLDLAKRGNICTDGTNPELTKIGWEITHSKLCSVMKKPRVEEMKATFEEMVLKDEGLKLKLMFNHHRYEVEHEERKKRALKKEKEGKRKEMKEKKEEGTDLREDKKRMAEPLGTVDRCFRGREAFTNRNWQRSTTLSSWFRFPTMIFQGLRGVQYGVGSQELLRAAVLGGKVQTKKEVVAS